MRIFLIRHPQPIVDIGICYGSTDLDVHQPDIDRTLHLLQTNLPDSALLFSSPLQRCAKLAMQVGRLLDVPVVLDSRLVEMDFGRWEMCAWDSIPRTEIDSWANNLIHYPVGGAETVAQMAARVSEFYCELMQLQTQHPHPQDCIVICHAGTIRLLQACSLGLSIDKMAEHAASSNQSIRYGDYVVLNNP